jgi:chaperonin cofactor prefoldin
MDTPTSATPDEKAPPLEMALATQLSKLATQENSKVSDPLQNSAERIKSSVARLSSSSIDELQGLVSELQKMQEFLKSEVDSVQRQIDSALAGINIIVETIGPWKSIAGSQTSSSSARNGRAGGPAANLEQRIRVG